MTVKELMNFLSKQNPDAKVTLTKDVEPDDGYEEAYYEDAPDKKEWPNEFTSNYSYCEIPNSTMAISEMRDRIMAKLYKKFSTGIEANNRFAGLDLD